MRIGCPSGGTKVGHNRELAKSLKNRLFLFASLHLCGVVQARPLVAEVSVTVESPQVVTPEAAKAIDKVIKDLGDVCDCFSGRET